MDPSSSAPTERTPLLLGSFIKSPDFHNSQAQTTLVVEKERFKGHGHTLTETALVQPGEPPAGAHNRQYTQMSSAIYGIIPH